MLVTSPHGFPRRVFSQEGLGQLSFSFEISLEGLDADSLMARQARDASSSDGETAPSYRTDIKRALGNDTESIFFLKTTFGINANINDCLLTATRLGHDPSVYFTAALYRPVVQFVDGGNKVLDGLAKEMIPGGTQTRRKGA
eukprot:scaffold77805_cov22-Prasinocladus_malaysianus.AAC.1